MATIGDNQTDHIEISDKLEKLRTKMKYTSTVRFFSAQRIRENYKIAQLTVVALSLWAIVIAYLLTTDIVVIYRLNSHILTVVGFILPVFIIVFSLIENGDSLLRSHQLEFNARQLRELSDKLYTQAAVIGLNGNQLLDIYGNFSEKYSDCLERTPINHDDVDHLFKLNMLKIEETRKIKKFAENNEDLSRDSRTSLIIVLYLTRQVLRTRIHAKKLFYVTIWAAPSVLFFIK